MNSIRFWLTLLVLSATGIIYFSSCSEKCDCAIPMCYSDTSPPDPFIQFSLVDSLGRSLSVINVTETRRTYIDSLKIFQDTIEIAQNSTGLCNRDICFKFNHVPNRETINKFVIKSFFLDIHFKNQNWDRDTVVIAYKTDSLDCDLDSIKVFYNKNFSFIGLNRTQKNDLGFDNFNFIRKL